MISIQHVKASLHTHLHFVQKGLRTFFEGGGVALGQPGK